MLIPNVILRAFSLLSLLLILTAFSAPTTTTAEGISCQAAVGTMIPCFYYLRAQPGTQIGAPSQRCCTAVQSLYADSKTKEDRVSICECFKKAGPREGVVPERAQVLPKLCKVDLPVLITPNMNCSTLN